MRRIYHDRRRQVRASRRRKSDDLGDLPHADDRFKRKDLNPVVAGRRARFWTGTLHSE